VLSKPNVLLSGSLQNLLCDRGESARKDPPGVLRYKENEYMDVIFISVDSIDIENLP
jgi:hypothetical protein